MKNLNNTTETENSWDCKNCQVEGKWLTPNIIYEAQTMPS